MNNQINQEEWLKVAVPLVKRKYKLLGTVFVITGLVIFGALFFLHQFSFRLTDLMYGGIVMLSGLLIRWYASSGKIKDHLVGKF